MNKVKIFADECVHMDVVVALRDSGFTVETVHDCDLSGVTDDEIFEHVLENKQILLTFDRGFGNMFQFDHAVSMGVVIVLIKQMQKEEIKEIVSQFFSSYKNLVGKLVIIGKNKIRVLQRS